MYMECASSDTPSLLTAPELTRLRANHPCVVFAGIIRSGDVVLAQVSCGRELTLKPGLNIIGGVQPCGLGVLIAPITDIEAMLDDDGVLSMDIESMLDPDDILGIDLEAVLKIDATSDMEGMLEVAAIAETDDILDISIIAIPPDVLEPLMSILFPIPDILKEETRLVIEDTLPAWGTRAVPAWRM